MGGETISIQYLKALRGEIVWDMSSILSVDHHRCAMQGMSMGQVLNVQNVIVHHRQKWLQGAIFANNGLKYQGKSHMKTLIQIFRHTERVYLVIAFQRNIKDIS